MYPKSAVCFLVYGNIYIASPSSKSDFLPADKNRRALQDGTPLSYLRPLQKSRFLHRFPSCQALFEGWRNQEKWSWGFLSGLVWERSGFGRFLLLRGERIWEVGVAKPSFFVWWAKVLAKLLERQHTPESQKPSVLPISTTDWGVKLFFARSLERERTWWVAQK